MTHANTNSCICLTQRAATKLLCMSLINEGTEKNLLFKEFNAAILLFETQHF